MQTRSERKTVGKTLRDRVPLRSHGQWSPAVSRPDPIDLLQRQDEGRVKQLLPIKYGRMLASPFAFLRGSAVVMAADLAATPVTGINAILCGDAHLSNFGVFATPERQLVFDLNDFDEAYSGPWEWDLKRLAASAVIAGRENGFKEASCRDLAIAAARAYAKAMNKFSRMSTLDQWYHHVSVDSVLKVFKRASKSGHRAAARMVKKAQTRTHAKNVDKLTQIEEGQRRFISDPPLLVPMREANLAAYLNQAEIDAFTVDTIKQTWGRYLDSLPDESRFLLQRFEIVDVAFRVGGIGSIGTRCLIVLIKGGGEDDYFILQLKEAGASALEPYLGPHHYENHAQRVVIGQQLMQAASDIFLGWNRSLLTDFNGYWRQLKDMEGSADIADMNQDGLRTYLTVCGYCLARAHARTGDEIMIRGYLGKRNAFSKAIGNFAVAYADQTENDYENLVKAVKSGRIVAETGV